MADSIDINNYKYLIELGYKAREWDLTIEDAYEMYEKIKTEVTKK